MSRFKETLGLLSLAILLVYSIHLMSNHLSIVNSNSAFFQDSSYTVIIDAGHGGFDSGKVGILGTLEKNINLEIAKKVEKLLQACNVNVIMTRTNDAGLYDENSSSKKRQDMAKRLELMNSSNADCIISIHQNSYIQESIDGAQVFYYTGSDQGKELASLLQKSLISRVDPTNHRVEKSNDSYYLLKNSKTPIVIVECGFLSNKEESKKLVDESYQQKLAWAIHLGILQYLNLHTSE